MLRLSCPMLIKVNELLMDATQNRYGVPAINVINVETAHYAALAAEREHMPIIIQYYPGFKDYAPLSVIAGAAKYFAERSSVPIAVHQDHSAGYKIAIEGIRDGFPSVMVDGSSLPYEENVALTKSVVDVADVFNVDIEAELGHVGGECLLRDPRPDSPWLSALGRRGALQIVRERIAMMDRVAYERVGNRNTLILEKDID